MSQSQRLSPSLSLPDPRANNGAVPRRSATCLVERPRLTSLLACCALLLIATGGDCRAEEGDEVAMPAPLAERSLLLDAVECDGGIVAVGERGHVLVSRDGGDTWRQSRVPTIAR